MNTVKTIGVLTSGGDCPGLNAAIRAITKYAIRRGLKVLGIHDGWEGLVHDNKVEHLKYDDASGILNRGGTILGTSRFNPFKYENDKQKLLENVDKLKIDAVICIGGNGSLGIAFDYHKLGRNIVGIPKTIDNDVNGTELSIGFDSSINIVMKALDSIHSTAMSHHRIHVIEVMGRDYGWLATLGGLTGGADIILIPEQKPNISNICKLLKKRQREKRFSIVVVAEGVNPLDLRLDIDDLSHFAPLYKFIELVTVFVIP